MTLTFSKAEEYNVNIITHSNETGEDEIVNITPGKPGTLIENMDKPTIHLLQVEEDSIGHILCIPYYKSYCSIYKFRCPFCKKLIRGHSSFHR